MKGKREAKWEWPEQVLTCKKSPVESHLRSEKPAGWLGVRAFFDRGFTFGQVNGMTTNYNEGRRGLAHVKVGTPNYYPPEIFRLLDTLPRVRWVEKPVKGKPAKRVQPDLFEGERQRTQQIADDLMKEFISEMTDKVSHVMADLQVKYANRVAKAITGTVPVLRRKK
jgi:hypothetical protein